MSSSFRKALSIICFVGGILLLSLMLYDTFHRDDACFRDITQIQLMGKALRNGTNAYDMISVLQEQYCGRTKVGVLPHPTPYPPTISPLAVLFSFFSPYQLFVLWTLFSIACGYSAIFLIGRFEEVTLSWLDRLGLLGILLCLPATVGDLFYGQFGLFFLLVCVVTQYLLAKSRDFYAGLLIGVTCALKFFGWPYLLVYLLLRRWRFIGGAAVSFLAFALLGFVLVPLESWIAYFTIAAPEVSQRWSQSYQNLGLLHFLTRVLDGVAIVNVDGQVAAYSGITPSTVVALGSTIFFVLLTIVLGIRVVRLEERERFNRILIYSTIANPVAWMFYFVPLSLPLFMTVIMGRKDGTLNNKSQRRQRALVISFLLILLCIDFADVYWLLAPDGRQEGLIHIGFLGRTILSVPTLICLYLALRAGRSASLSSQSLNR